MFSCESRSRCKLRPTTGVLRDLAHAWSPIAQVPRERSVVEAPHHSLSVRPVAWCSMSSNQRTAASPSLIATSVSVRLCRMALRSSAS